MAVALTLVLIIGGMAVKYQEVIMNLYHVVGTKQLNDLVLIRYEIEKRMCQIIIKCVKGYLSLLLLNPFGLPFHNSNNYNFSVKLSVSSYL